VKGQTVIIVTGTVITTPRVYEEALALCMAHSARSRAEPGCIGHNVHVDCEDPSRLVFVEYWSDMPALLAHFQVQESRDLVKALRKLCPTSPGMKVFAAEPQPIA
jgi:quinol monooxygenase YgiN